MITECAADLLTRVRNVTSLAGDKTGLTIGGKTPDPSLLKPNPPFAWVMYDGEQPDEAPYGSSSQGGYGLVPDQELMLSKWIVLVYLPYVNDSDLLTTQYPLLEAVALSVKTSITDPNGGIQFPNGYRWRYAGQKRALVYHDRVAYEQHYTLQIPI